MRLQQNRKSGQAGFTLIELIIVIVVIGILAAVAIPKISGVSTEATKAKNTAILGAVKSAWSVAFAVARSEPTGTQVAAQMADPSCTDPASGTTMTCGGLGITLTLSSGKVATPSNIACTTAADCN